MLGRQCGEGLLDDAQGFAVGGEIGELRPRRRRLGPTQRVVVFGRIEWELGTPSPRPKFIKRAVGNDPENPCAEGCPLERAERFPRRQERVLHRIFGVVVTKHSSRMAIEGPFDLERELLEGPRVAAPCAIEERIGRPPDVRPHQRTFAWLQLLL